MLLNTPRRYAELPSEVDSIHNYYEHLVLEEIARTSERSRQDMNFLADVACVALNRLPPRYIRHDVDMTFFMSPMELQEIQDKTKNAVAAAIDYVSRREAERMAAEQLEEKSLTEPATESDAEPASPH
ncbi:late competence development ComFB family protein [Maricurvus nonylphenolicus]|uniref:late competence development ComFB family protein n=1 Tax=Maricurvus nonylphenolicus TaxID=1008307 RepID=UPI0036F26A2B